RRRPPPDLLPPPLRPPAPAPARRKSPPPPSHDPHRSENTAIVNFLKHLINPVSTPTDAGLRKKRVRKRKEKCETNAGKIEPEIVNKNGVVVDFAALVDGDDLYAAELRRRTVGLDGEEEVLGFLRGLEGEWCSRRKKRKIVEASGFGDALPVDWKLLLALKRREGRVSVYCRRYIRWGLIDRVIWHPSGQHFVSCKEASSYLQSYFGCDDASQSMDQRTGSNQDAYAVASGCHAGSVHKASFAEHDTISASTLPCPSLPKAHQMEVCLIPSIYEEREKEISLIGIDNLPEVQVRDLYECDKCNMTFDEKNIYMQHLLSYHHNTTRRYRLRASIGEGVIIKDGKYECQFCHKVFLERRSYNGHVGTHVRSLHVRNNESPGQVIVQRSISSSLRDELPSRICKMDAMNEIAQNPIQETSSDGPNKPEGGSTPNKLDTKKTSAASSDCELSLDSRPNEMEDCMADRALDQELMIDEKIVKSDDISNFGNSMVVACTSNSEHPEFNKVIKCGNTGLETCSEIGHVKPNNDVVTEPTQRTVDENFIQSVTGPSVPLVQLSEHFPAVNAETNKGENKFCATGQNLDNLLGFEELKFDEMEALGYDFVNGQESPCLPEVSRDLANGAEMEDRTEFNYEGIDLETQSDSIGFMCPTCKDKISGHLDCGLSMNSQCF
ncbi:hypothetical protein RJ639_041079, partial [Escallonia herrerae]